MISYSAIVRFNQSGGVDAYDLSTGWYSSDNPFSYSQDQIVQIRMVVDVPSNTYDVYAKDESDNEVMVADDYQFRASASSLDRWNIHSDIDSMVVCDAEVLTDFHEADTNTNNIIELTELNSYIQLWITTSDITLPQLIEVVELWKNA